MAPFPSVGEVGQQLLSLALDTNPSGRPTVLTAFPKFGRDRFWAHPGVDPAAQSRWVKYIFDPTSPSVFSILSGQNDDYYLAGSGEDILVIEAATNRIVGYQAPPSFLDALIASTVWGFVLGGVGRLVGHIIGSTSQIANLVARWESLSRIAQTGWTLVSAIPGALVAGGGEIRSFWDYLEGLALTVSFFTGLYKGLPDIDWEKLSRELLQVIGTATNYALNYTIELFVDLAEPLYHVIYNVLNPAWFTPGPLQPHQIMDPARLLLDPTGSVLPL